MGSGGEARDRLENLRIASRLWYDAGNELVFHRLLGLRRYREMAIGDRAPRRRRGLAEWTNVELQREGAATLTAVE